MPIHAISRKQLIPVRTSAQGLFSQQPGEGKFDAPADVPFSGFFEGLHRRGYAGRNGITGDVKEAWREKRLCGFRL
jgi:hypothetical protein